MLRITPTPSLAALTTLGIGGIAAARIHVDTKDAENLPKALATLGFGFADCRVLGGGSNLLVQEGEIPIVLISPQAEEENHGISLLSADNALARVSVSAHTPLPLLLQFCAQHGFTGLEGLVGVPGRAGGAIAMNAGGYGMEVGSLLEELTVFTPENGLVTLKRTNGVSPWQSRYRHFSLAMPGQTEPESMLIFQAVLAMPITSANAVKAAMQQNLAAKKQSQPLGEKSAGCVFKNPAGESAGKLLDAAGFKGKTNGPVAFSQKHANFLVHTAKKQESAGAYAAAKELITEAKDTVAQKTGIHLELEVRVWPCPLF